MCDGSVLGVSWDRPRASESFWTAARFITRRPALHPPAWGPDRIKSTVRESVDYFYRFTSVTPTIHYLAGLRADAPAARHSTRSWLVPSVHAAAAALCRRASGHGRALGSGNGAGETLEVPAVVSRRDRIYVLGLFVCLQRRPVHVCVRVSDKRNPRFVFSMSESPASCFSAAKPPLPDFVPQNPRFLFFRRKTPACSKGDLLKSVPGVPGTL